MMTSADAFVRGLPAAAGFEGELLGDAMHSATTWEEARKLRADEFSQERHRKIFLAMQEVAEAGVVPPTLSAVTLHLLDRGILQDVGGVETLSNLFQFPLTQRTAKRYREVISKKAAQARALRTVEVLWNRAQDVDSDPAELVARLELAAAELRDAGSSSAGSIASLPGVFEAEPAPLTYIDEHRLIAAGTITALTGDSGVGKSSATMGVIIRPVLASGRSVLVGDRENPHFVVSDRMRAYGIPDSPLLRYAGGWLPNEAPQPGSREVMEWALALDPKPLIVVDSLVAFLEADENDSGAMRKWMSQCRALADRGCAVLILHHIGKSDTAQEYRGSSDFRAAVDVGYKLTNWSPDGQLGLLRFKCWKSRFGKPLDLAFQYCDGEFRVADTDTQSTETNSDRLLSVLRTNPGVSTAEFEKRAVEVGVARSAARNWLENSVRSGAVHTKRIGANGRSYRLADRSVSEDSFL